MAGMKAKSARDLENMQKLWEKKMWHMKLSFTKETEEANAIISQMASNSIQLDEVYQRTLRTYIKSKRDYQERVDRLNE